MNRSYKMSKTLPPQTYKKIFIIVIALTVAVNMWAIPQGMVFVTAGSILLLSLMIFAGKRFFDLKFEKPSDERSIFISHKAGFLTYTIFFVLSAAAYMILTALRYKTGFANNTLLTGIWIGIAISYAFTGIAYAISYAYYSRKY